MTTKKKNPSFPTKKTSKPLETIMENSQKKEIESSSIYKSIRSLTPVLDNFSKNINQFIDKYLYGGKKYYLRKNELKVLARCLHQRSKRHILLIGESGVGKSCIVYGFVQSIINGEFQNQFSNLKVKEFDLNRIIAGAKYRGQAEERLFAITAELQKESDILLFVNNFVSQINNKDIVSNTSYYLKNILRDDSTRIITECTNKEYESIMNMDASILSNFSIINISEPNKTDTLRLINTQIEDFESHYSCIFSQESLKRIIELSNLYIPDKSQPRKSIELIDEICATKELSRVENPKDPLFNINQDIQKKLIDIRKIATLKINAVKNQDFKTAANQRDKEKSELSKLVKLEAKFKSIKESTKESITSRDIIKIIASLSGISEDNVANKIEIPNKNVFTKTMGINSLPQFEMLQTQSILHGNKITISKGRGFVLIPHDEEHDNIFELAIKPALNSHSLIALKASDIYKPGSILSQVWSEIRSAEVLIADVSGRNPNVIFELGLSYGIQRCPIIITQNVDELPFNIRTLRYIEYENSAKGINTLQIKLTQAIGEFLSAVRT